MNAGKHSMHVTMHACYNADHAANGEASNNKHLRLSSKKKSNPIPHERFSFLSSEKVEEAKQAIIPKNTKKCTDLSIRTFRLWLTQRNQWCASGNECPDLLLTDDHELLWKWLCIFVSELRKTDGNQYTPRSIAQLFAALQRYINNKKSEPVRIVVLSC